MDGVYKRGWDVVGSRQGRGEKENGVRLSDWMETAGESDVMVYSSHTFKHSKTLGARFQCDNNHNKALGIAS